MANETVDHEFEEILQEVSSDVTVEEILEFDECVDTCQPEVNTSSVDWGEELRTKCIQSVINQNVETDDNCSESEDNEDDAMEIDSKSAVNSGEALNDAENDAENEVLQSLTSLTKKVEKMRIWNLRKKNYH